MLTLSSAAILEKNKLCSDGAWLVLAEIRLPDGVTVFRVCRNTANIGWPLVAINTAAAVDKGAGKVGIPVTAHGYAAADTIVISGSTHYDGEYTVDSETANEVVIVHVYTAETFGAPAKIAFDWIAFPFDLDDLSDQSKNEVPQVNLRVSNVSRAIQVYLEAGEGGVGASVTLRVVHSQHLALAAAEYEVKLRCMDCQADSKWVTFVLGAPSPFTVRFPRNRILKDFCRWKFKSTECGYAGATATCDKTLTACRAMSGGSNSARFGAFPGVGFGGVYV